MRVKKVVKYLRQVCCENSLSYLYVLWSDINISAFGSKQKFGYLDMDPDTNQNES
jgi:mannosyltransferase OCH1-like enzyme